MGKEALARAANSQDLGMEPGVIHDVDHLIAMAGGDTLGGLLLRFRESGQSQWGRRIVFILARRVIRRFKLGRDTAIRVAVAALEEFAQPHCVVCHGAREMVFDKLKVTCDACGGSGKRRWTNASRRARVGTYGARIDSAMAECHRDMSCALGALLAHAAGKLE